MNHLGTRISALADGQLEPAEAERAFAHVAACPDCAADLAATRAAHRVLAGARDVPVTAGLTSRLLALATETPPAAPRRSESWDRPSGGEPDLLAGDLTRRRRAAGGLPAAALVGAGALMMSLLILGEEREVVPNRHPAHALSVLAGTSETAPAVAVDLTADAREQLPAWMDLHSWAWPGELPADLRVGALRSGGEEAVRLEIIGQRELIVVTEQHGRLVPCAGVAVTQIGEHQVYVLSMSPWHGVLQSGGTVVAVYAERHSDSVEALIAAYPGDSFDDGVPARISRGWDVLAGAWSP